MKLRWKLSCLIMVLALDAAFLGLGCQYYTMDKEVMLLSGREEADGLPGGKQIALTFDDGPSSSNTPRLLEGLKKRGVHASFFLLGEQIDGNEEIVRQMYEDGHLIGNHGYSHVQLSKESSDQACVEIERTNQKIREITGQVPAYIRPPYGSWSESLDCTVPMTVVLWSIDPVDWKSQNTGKVVRHIVKNAEPGSIILLHDVFPTSVDAALEVIDTLSRQGYTFVTVDELLVD